MPVRRAINEYLFHEFGMDEDPSKICDDWPFLLSLAGTLSAARGPVDVYTFVVDGESYFATDGVLSMLPTAGMSLADFQDQMTGSAQISEWVPVDLNTSLPSADDVPALRERQSAIAQLARNRGIGGEFAVREGLYCRRTSEYLAVVECAEGVFVLGSSMALTRAPFPDASAWRRLAVVVGRLSRTPDQ